MKIIKYQLATEINLSGVRAVTLSGVTMPYTDANYAIAQTEAYQGQITVEDDGYSRAGNWEADMRGTYARGSSYRGRKRDSMGRYSRDGRYSRHASPDMMDKLQTMMDNASTERERDAIRRLMNEMEME